MRLSKHPSFINEHFAENAPTRPSSYGSPDKPTNEHEETVCSRWLVWKTSTSGDGDTAMFLFSRSGEVHVDLDPKEAKRLERKIDYMILPYLTVSVETVKHG